jgi:hypothetical protein
MREIRNAHVHDFPVIEIHLGRGSRPFHHESIVFLGQLLQRVVDHLEAFLHGESLMVLPTFHRSEDLSEKDDLAPAVHHRLEEDWVHVHGRQRPSRLGLHSLRPANLLSIIGNVGIVGHVLTFEWGNLVSQIGKHAAKTGHDEALAGVAGRTLDHDTFELAHKVIPYSQDYGVPLVGPFSEPIHIMASRQ